MSTEEKPTIAFVLSLIGGILWLLWGVVAAFVGAIVTFEFLGIGAIFGIYVIVMNLIIMLGAIMLYQNHKSANMWGIIILIIAIIAPFNIFALIGGILAMTWKPGGAAPAAGAPAITRICPQCGRVIDKDVKFCPHCGKTLE